MVSCELFYAVSYIMNILVMCPELVGCVCVSLTAKGNLVGTCEAERW